MRALIQRRFPAGSFGRGVVMIAAGTATAQALNLLLSPVIARLYGPAAFGIFGVYASIVTILLPLASLRFEMAIPLPREDARAVALLRLSGWTLLGTTLATGAAVLVGGGALARWLHAPELGGYAWAIPLGLAAGGGYQLLSYWAVRRNAYGLITRTRLWQGVSQSAMQLAGGALSSSPVGLLAGDVVGRGGGVLRLWGDLRQTSAGIEPASIAEAASRYRRFALLTAPASVLNAIAPQLPALLLVRLYGPAVGGLYALGQRLLAAPILLVGQSIGQVFQSEGARLVRESPDQLPGLFDRTAARLLRLGTLPILAGAIVAPVVIPLLFGDRWRDAGPFVQSLALAYMAEIVVSPLSSSAVLAERQHLELIMGAVRVILIVATFWWIGHAGFSPLAAIRTYAAMMLVTYVLFFLTYRYGLSHLRATRAPAGAAS